MHTKTADMWSAQSTAKMIKVERKEQTLQESTADAVKPARRKSMPKLLQFDVFRFISPNSISPNYQCIASRGRPMFSQALGLYSCTQFEIRCLPIIKFLVQIAST